jgi:hypothetical protein
MKRILTAKDKNWRPQLGAELQEYMQVLLNSTNMNNLSNNWSETDMARYCMAHGIRALTHKPIPNSVKNMFKRFDKDLDIE